MRKRYIAAALAVALAGYAAGFVMLNGNAVGAARDLEERPGAVSGAPAPEVLNVTIWNLGYGGLGAGSDFVADGGAHMFPPSRRAVRANVDAIVGTLAVEAPNTDVFIFQEIARAGPVNYWIDLKGRIDTALQTRRQVFYADFKTRLMPWPLRMEHGQAIYADFPFASADLVALPAEDSAIFGVKRRYASVVARLPMQGGGEWVIASVHLAAFDEDAAVRTRQLRELLAWAEREYAAGRHVIIGGDWNFQLGETHFPHTTDERFLFWLFPFPREALGEGWRIGADLAVPSVRTNHQPYVAGENYVTSIDGFVVSPNVEIESVGGIDLGFEHTDHQPVRLRARAIREQQ